MEFQDAPDEKTSWVGVLAAWVPVWLVKIDSLQFARWFVTIDKFGVTSSTSPTYALRQCLRDRYSPDNYRDARGRRAKHLLNFLELYPDFVFVVYRDINGKSAIVKL